MPGGSDYRQWYAARKAMQQRGTWRGKHAVPAQEEGEPPSKKPELMFPSDWNEPGASSDTGSVFERLAEDSSSPGSAVGSSTVVSETSPGTPDSLPPLEDAPTAEGNYESRLHYSVLDER